MASGISGQNDPADEEDPGVSPGTAAFVAVEGVAALLVGVAALAFPMLTGAAVATFLGWVLVASGVAGLAGCVGGRHHLHLGWSAVSAVLGILAGLAILFHPIAGAMPITDIVGVWLALDGIASLMLALDVRRSARTGWIWLLVSAVIDWILAAVILVIGTAGSVVDAGLIVGLDLALAGAGMLLMTASWRRARR